MWAVGLACAAVVDSPALSFAARFVEMCCAVDLAAAVEISVISEDLEDLEDMEGMEDIGDIKR